MAYECIIFATGPLTLPSQTANLSLFHMQCTVLWYVFNIKLGYKFSTHKQELLILYALKLFITLNEAEFKFIH
jgi:hypothetical protein